MNCSEDRRGNREDNDRNINKGREAERYLK
jgi:hypothetical protein